MLQEVAATPAEVLKRDTAEAHRCAEEALLPRLVAIRSAKEYAEILQMFYGFFGPLESRIRQIITSSLLHDIADRRSSLYLVEDLKALGMTPLEVPTCESVSKMDSVAKSFGAMYVLEGSTLGGRMIAKMLAKNDAVPQTALRFFNGYGEQTGAKWKTFIEALNRQTDVGLLVDGANETFEDMKDWMLHSFAKP